MPCFFCILWLGSEAPGPRGQVSLGPGSLTLPAEAWLGNLSPVWACPCGRGNGPPDLRPVLQTQRL